MRVLVERDPLTFDACILQASYGALQVPLLGLLDVLFIMPFSKTTDEHDEQYWTRHFESYLKPLIEEIQNIEARRSAPLRGDIVREILRDLYVSTIVIANLTDNNPNVHWEVGVRQSLKPCTITIAEEGSPIDFNIGGKNVLRYHPKDHQVFRSGLSVQ